MTPTQAQTTRWDAWWLRRYGRSARLPNGQVIAPATPPATSESEPGDAIEVPKFDPRSIPAEARPILGDALMPSRPPSLRQAVIRVRQSMAKLEVDESSLALVAQFRQFTDALKAALTKHQSQERADLEKQRETVYRGCRTLRDGLQQLREQLGRREQDLNDSVSHYNSRSNKLATLDANQPRKESFPSAAELDEWQQARDAAQAKVDAAQEGQDRVERDCNRLERQIAVAERRLANAESELQNIESQLAGGTFEPIQGLGLRIDAASEREDLNF